MLNNSFNRVFDGILIRYTPYRYMVAGMILLFTFVFFPVFAVVPRGVDMAKLADWDIVVSEEASSSEVYAAEEFQRHFGKASGIQLAIIKQSSGLQHHIFIGSSPSLRSSNISFSTEDFGKEDFRIIARDNNIAIAGGRPRGTLYGVYTFLEEYIGVRFLTFDHTYIPHIGSWHVIGPVDRFYHPPLRCRWSCYAETNINPEFAARTRTNWIWEGHTIDAKLGGRTGLDLVNHNTFHSDITPEKYGKEHPEYFAMVDGERKLEVGGGGPQLCLSNPEVLRNTVNSVLDTLKKNPDMENIVVAQNDNDKYCCCPNCAAIDEREGTPMGSILTFVNAVADEVAGEYSDVMVGTFSYWYSRKPPKTIKPRPNVQIQLCNIECCLIHPIDDPACDKNKQFCIDMANWGKICKNISIWSYNANFSNYLLPLPNLRTVGPNVRYLVANNAMGIFMQGSYISKGAEMSDLRNYITANLLWNPNLNGQKLMDEFLDLHYGRASGPIRRFINLTHDNALAKKVHKNCFGKAKDFAIDESLAQAGLDAFAEAMKLAENDTIRFRVEKASICAYRAAVEPIWYIDDASLVDPALAKEMRPLVEKLSDLCRKYDVVETREGGNDLDKIKRIVGL